jgi:mono/diheme cytochrome c family protein
MSRVLFVLILVAACGKNNEPPPPSSGSPNAQPESAPKKKGAADQARAMFDTVCATCHGADGTGNGPAAASLTPKPRNYTDAAWQASVTDEDLKKTILLGGQGVGKSPMMPGQPQLKEQPEVLNELIKIIRGFGKAGSAAAAPAK